MEGSREEYQPLVHRSRGISTAPAPQQDPQGATRRSNDWFMQQSSWVLIGLGILLASLMGAAFTVIPPGQVGIVVTLGRASTFAPGAHIRAPVISYLDTMSTKTQLLEQKNVIPTKEGLSVQLDTAV